MPRARPQPALPLPRGPLLTDFCQVHIALSQSAACCRWLDVQALQLLCIRSDMVLVKSRMTARLQQYNVRCLGTLLFHPGSLLKCRRSFAVHTCMQGIISKKMSLPHHDGQRHAQRQSSAHYRSHLGLQASCCTPQQCCKWCPGRWRCMHEVCYCSLTTVAS